MLEFNIKNGEVGKVIIAGDLDDIMAELMAEVNCIYNGIRMQNTGAAIKFKAMFKAMLNDEDAFELVFSKRELSSEWKTKVEADEGKKSGTKKVSEDECEKAIKNLADAVSELMKLGADDLEHGLERLLKKDINGK